MQIQSRTEKKKQVQTRWGASQLYVLNAYMVRWAYQVNYTAPASLTCQLSRRKELGGQLKQCRNIKKARMCQSAHHLHIWPSAHCHMTLIAQINQFLNWTPTPGVLMDAIKNLKRHSNVYFKKGETLPKSLYLSTTRNMNQHFTAEWKAMLTALIAIKLSCQLIEKIDST